MCGYRNMGIETQILFVTNCRDGNNYNSIRNHIISYVVCMCMNDCVFKYSSC